MCSGKLEKQLYEYTIEFPAIGKYDNRLDQIGLGGAARLDLKVLNKIS